MKKFIKLFTPACYIPCQHICHHKEGQKAVYLKNIYRVSQEECARLRGGVPYVKVYRYNPKHLCPKLNGYGDNGQRKVWSSCASTHCTCQLTMLSISVLECGCHITASRLSLAIELHMYFLQGECSAGYGCAVNGW